MSKPIKTIAEMEALTCEMMDRSDVRIDVGPGTNWYIRAFSPTGIDTGNIQRAKISAQTALRNEYLLKAG